MATRAKSAALALLSLFFLTAPLGAQSTAAPGTPMWSREEQAAANRKAWGQVNYDTSAIGPEVGYVRRTGGHGISAVDWQWMLDFADRYFQAIPVPSR